MLLARIERGDPTPFWDQRPQSPEMLSWVWRAFDALITCRSVGMAEGPIPWTAVDRYAQRYGIDGDAFEMLSAWVRIMERAVNEKEEPR